MACCVFFLCARAESRLIEAAHTHAQRKVGNDNNNNKTVGERAAAQIIKLKFLFHHFSRSPHLSVFLVLSICALLINYRRERNAAIKDNHKLQQQRQIRAEWNRKNTQQQRWKFNGRAREREYISERKSKQMEKLKWCC